MKINNSQPQRSGMTQKAFSITDGKGFQLTFPNGYTVSVQFGWGNYTENYCKPEWISQYDLQKDKIKQGIYPETQTAETALMNEGGFVSYKDDEVQGYQTITEVLELLNYAAALPKYVKPNPDAGSFDEGDE